MAKGYDGGGCKLSPTSNLIALKKGPEKRREEADSLNSDLKSPDIKKKENSVQRMGCSERNGQC